MRPFLWVRRRCRATNNKKMGSIENTVGWIMLSMTVLVVLVVPPSIIFMWLPGAASLWFFSQADTSKAISKANKDLSA